MKDIIDFFLSKDIVFTKLERLEPKMLKIRNKIALYRAVDLKRNYVAIFVLEQKTKVLQKDIDKFELILSKMSSYYDHLFLKKTILVKAPLCSKAKEKLKQNSWKVYHVFS